MSVGIDLGTTYSYIYILPKCIKVDLPSYVWFPPNKDDDPIFGEEAKEEREKDLKNKNIVFGLKHLICRSYVDIQLEDFEFPFDISTDGKINIPRDDGTNDFFTPMEITKLLLTEMKNKITDALQQQNIESVVVAFPGSFTIDQISAMDATLRDVFSDVTTNTITEHAAAAITYKDSMKEAGDDQENILLVDFGGAMLNIAHISLTWTASEIKDRVVVGQTKYNSLGGRNFTDDLYQHYRKKTSGQPTPDQEADLRKTCDNAKKALSGDVSRCNFPLDSALFPGEDGFLSLDTFNEICSDRFDIVEDLLDKFKSEVVQKVLLVGGAARMQEVAKRVKNVFGENKEIVYPENFDYAIAYGAAQYASQLVDAGEVDASATNIYESIRYSLGIETRGGLMEKIIEKCTLTDTYVEKKRTFHTTVDDQEKVNIRVYEGERALAKHNFFVGEFTVPGIPKAPRGVPQVEVSFIAQNDGFLLVSASVKVKEETVKKSKQIPRGSRRQEGGTTRDDPEFDQAAIAAITVMKSLESYISFIRGRFAKGSTVVNDANKASAWVTKQLQTPSDQRDYKRFDRECKDRHTSLRESVERAL